MGAASAVTATPPRLRSFHIRQPSSSDDDSSDGHSSDGSSSGDDDFEPYEARTKRHSNGAAAEARAARGMAALAAAASVADRRRTDDAEYEYLQSALNSMQLHYSETMATAVEQKAAELDAALALALGIEPPQETLAQLAATPASPGPRDSSSTFGSPGAAFASPSVAGSPLLARAREQATQLQVTSVRQQLAGRDAASLQRVHSDLAQLTQMHRAVFSDLQAKHKARETQIGNLLQQNLLTVTRARDEKRRQVAEAQRAEAAAQAAREEAVRAAQAAKEEAEAAAKKAAEEAEAQRQAQEAKSKADADAASKAAADCKAAAAAAAAAFALEPPSPTSGSSFILISLVVMRS